MREKEDHKSEEGREREGVGINGRLEERVKGE